MEIDPILDSLHFDAAELRLLPLLKEKERWPATEADNIFSYAEWQRKQLRRGLVDSPGLAPDQYQAGLSDYNTVCRLQSLLSPYLHRETDYS